MTHLAAGYRTASKKKNRIRREPIKARDVAPHLAKESAPENALSSIEPINDWICVFFHGCGENYERVPGRYLDRSTAVSTF